MLYREIIAVCSQIHTKHINTLCEQNVEFMNVKSGGTCSNHWALEAYWIAPLTFPEVSVLKRLGIFGDVCFVDKCTLVPSVNFTLQVQ